MDLGRISIEARLRTPWEAIDLGFVMVRAWWKPLFLSWFIPSFVVFVISSVVFSNISWVPYVLVWWLKPLWDRGPLYIASRRLFGEEVGVADVLRNLWRLYKTEWFYWLTLRRFSFTRSFDMPLTVLENLKGSSRSSRQVVLHRNHSGAASWLTVVGIHTEGFFVIGIFALVAIMIPEQIDIDYWGVLVEQDELFVLANNFLTFLAMSLIGPFYAVAGFALYISRRIDLEAWDVEIRFRHLASVYQKKTQRGARGVLPSIGAFLVGFGLLLSLVHSAPAVASDLESKPSGLERVVTTPVYEQKNVAGETSKEQILSIIEGRHFHRVEMQSGWRIVNLESAEPEEIPRWLFWVVDFFEKYGGVFTAIAKVFKYPLQYLEIILWGLLILVVVIIAYRYRNSIMSFLSSRDREASLQEAPEVMFGLDVTKESLPEDIPATVQALWQAGDYREAVSLLYRALLTGLIHQYGFAFADSHTEGECVAIVKSRQNVELTGYVAKLTQCWQLLAYGHLLPNEADIVNLCQRWPEVFGDE